MFHFAIKSLVVLVFLSQALEEPQQKSIDEIVTLLIRTETAVHNVSVATEYVKRQKDFLPVENPIQLQLVTKSVVDSMGRAWYDTFGEQVNMGPEPDDVSIYRGRWQGAFDGTAARTMTGDSDGVFHWAAIDNYLVWHGVNPLEFTTHYNGTPVSKLLKEREASIVDETMWEGRAVKIVETRAVKWQSGPRGRYRFWVDVDRAVVVRRATLVQYAEDQKWQESSRIESREHKEVRPGIWLPSRMKYEAVRVTKEQAPEELSWSYEGRNTEWQVNRELPAETFQLTFPESVVVTDRRTPKPDGER
jgi:hypothetical protein